ncbi:hypothetical protein C8R47DRAFT_257712 [Mycena vitilis]|nr:hypothetical protein C8R47DRAFT_257712 [Mycena vitilis]
MTKSILTLSCPATQALSPANTRRTMLSKPTSGRSTIAEYRCTARLATEDSGIVVSDTAEPYINNRAPKRRRVHDDIGADEGPGTVPRGASIGPEPDLPVRRAIVKTSPAPSTKTSVEEVRVLFDGISRSLLRLTLRPPKCDTAAPSLPISSWFLGLNLVSEPCRLIWNADGAVIVRSCVATQSEGGRTEAICRRSLAEIWFVDPCEPYRNKVLVLDSFLHSNQKPVDTHLSDHAKRGLYLCSNVCTGTSLNGGHRRQGSQSPHRNQIRYRISYMGGPSLCAIHPLAEG